LSIFAEKEEKFAHGHFQQYFSYIMATSFSGGGRWSTLREPPTMGKQLVNFITCGLQYFPD
jgi:hypothetical protein